MLGDNPYLRFLRNFSHFDCFHNWFKRSSILQAFELIRGFRKRGIDVPGRVSVTGFDGIVSPRGCPKLSTIEIPFREIGATGTLRLIARVKKHFGSTQHVFIDGRLRTGATVASIRK